jgi:hypothetical protein
MWESDGYRKALIRRLKWKSKEVKEELSLCKEIYDKAALSFCSSVNEYCIKNNLEDPFKNIDKEQEVKKESLPKNLKAIFRKIATKTHTDITKDDSTRSLLEEAVQAKKENKSHDLISIARKLKIDTSNMDYESIRHLEQSIQDAEKDINSMHNSYPWLWFYSDSSKKTSIIKIFVSIKV